MTLSSVPRRCLSSRGNMSSTSLELNMNRGKLMKKRKNLTTVTMEAEKGEIPVEPTGVRAKRLTGRDYKYLYVKAALASGKSEKHRSFQGEEERSHSASKEKRHMEEHEHSPKKRRRLRKKYLQSSPEKINSGREDIGKETSYTDEGRSPVSYDMLRTVNSPLPQKLPFENRSDEIARGVILNKIPKLCDKRMKKLVQKQEEEIQDFNKVWDAKISKVLEDKKLQAAIICFIWGDGSIARTKLMILDDEFSKKEAEISLLRDVELKDLEAEHLAARNEESEKEANWLSKTKACISDKQTGCCNLQLGSQDEKASGCPESRTDIVGVEEAIPLTVQHEKNNNSSTTGREMHAVIDSKSDCAAAEKVGCNACNESPCNLLQSSKENEGGISFSDGSIPTVVEQINQPKHFGVGENICADLPASSGEMRSLELNRDVAADLPESVDKILYNEPVVSNTKSPIEGFRERDANEDGISFSGASIPTVGEQINQPKHFGEGENICADLPAFSGEMGSLELHRGVAEELPECVVHKIMDSPPVVSDNDSPIEGFRERDAIDLPDTLLKQRNDTDGTAIDDVDSAGHVLDASEQVKEDQGHVNSSPKAFVSELVDTATDFVSNVETQDQDEAATEIQSSARTDMTTSKIIDTVIAEQSYMELKDQDTPVVKDLPVLQKKVAESERVDPEAPISNLQIFSTEQTLQANSELQPQVELPTETPSRSRYEVAASEIMHNPAPVLSSTAAQDEDVLKVEQSSMELKEQDTPIVKDLFVFQKKVLETERIDPAESISNLEILGAEKSLQANIELQPQIEPATETQSRSRIEVAASEIMHNPAPVLSSTAAQDEDVLIAEQSSMELKEQDTPVLKDLFVLQKKVAESERVDPAASISNVETFGTEQTLQANIELQSQVEPATETQSRSRIEVAASEIMHNPAPVLSSTAVQDEDVLIVDDLITVDNEISDSGRADVATHVQPRSDGSESENCQQPRVMSVDESPSCNLLPSIELQSQSHNLERISSGTAETDKPLHGSTSQLREEAEPQNNNLDLGHGSQSPLEYISFQNCAALEIEMLHQDLETLLPGGATHRPPTHEVAAHSSPSLFANPLLNELERRLKETEELQKSHEKAMSCLKSECEKEIQELVAQVQNKYKLKAQDAQAQFRLKKDAIGRNQKKLLMNKLLSDSINYKCLKRLPTGPLMQHGPSSISMQQQQQQHFTRPAAATAPNLQTASLNGQAGQQISRPPTRPGPIYYPNVASLQAQLATLNEQALPQNSLPPLTRPGRIYAGQSVAPAQVQARRAAAISGLAARPGVLINGNHHPTTNPHVGGYIHSSANLLSSISQNYHLPQQAWPSSSQNQEYFGYPTAL